MLHVFVVACPIHWILRMTMAFVMTREKADYYYGVFSCAISTNGKSKVSNVEIVFCHVEDVLVPVE
jgi:hypothetical protein